jgi:hypothetical protein
MKKQILLFLFTAALLLIAAHVHAGYYVTYDVEGKSIHTEFYDWGWHFTLEMDTGGNHVISCTDLRLNGSTVGPGHWRNYALWGPEFYQLTRTWYYNNWPDSRDPGNYTATCTFYIY